MPNSGKALITGAYGFVGRHLATELLKTGFDVVASGRDRSSPAFFPAEAKHCFLDTLDPQSVRAALEEHTPSVIYHLAGISFVPQAEKDFPLSLAVNVSGLDNLLQAVVDGNPETRVIVISSPEVYRTPTDAELPLKESQPLAARNKYGLSRICGETVAGYYENKIKGGLVVLRPFTHIGVGQEDKFVVASFAKQLAEIKLGKREPRILVGNLEVERDFSDVEDIVQAYVKVASKGSGTYNLCSGTATRVGNLLQILLKIAGLKDTVTVEVDRSRVRANEMPTFYGDCSRAKEELHWQAKVPLEKSLANIFNEWMTRVA